MPTATLPRSYSLLATLLLIPGCHPIAHTSAVAEPAALSATPSTGSSRYSADLILPGEIEGAHVPNAFEAISRLRPEFLRPRGLQTPEWPNGRLPSVFVNDIEQREIEALRTVPSAAIVEIRYLSASAATPEFGRQHVGGVIAIRTRR